MPGAWGPMSFSVSDCHQGLKTPPRGESLSNLNKRSMASCWDTRLLPGFDVMLVAGDLNALYRRGLKTRPLESSGWTRCCCGQSANKPWLHLHQGGNLTPEVTLLKFIHQQGIEILNIAVGADGNAFRQNP
jgi:hypothetical protein